MSYTSLDAAPKSKRGVQITPKSAPALDTLYNQSYAVIIGVNAYDKWPSLEYAVKDARAMEEKLKFLGFQTTLLLDQHATKDNILKILGDELPQKVQKNDRVIIFFAGHGQTEEMADSTQMGYIIPVDADTRNIFSTAISMDQVRVFSRRLRAKHVLYLIDSCYAGLGLTRSGTIPPSERDYLRKITTRKAHQMLTAGGKGELAHEEGGHGVFTKYILDALDGSADRDEKGFITFSDLASYVKPKVSRYTGTKQVPQYGSIDGEGEFVFILTGMTTAVQSDSSGLERERQSVAMEKNRLEVEKRNLATQRVQMEEMKRLAKEKRRLEEEKQSIEAEKERLRIEKDDLARQNANLTHGQQVVAIRQPAPPSDAITRYNFSGLKVRVVYINKREEDAEAIRVRLKKYGASVQMYKTSDSGNAKFEGKIISKKGYEEQAMKIARIVSDIEAVSTSDILNREYQNAFGDGQQFNLWVAK
ncbi:MAG: caspase family protein [Deltaproteobacteria bacterium]|nr:caspase family protein [Deltaproteobacteria bacterium]